jgi:hypothetical protein
MTVVVALLCSDGAVLGADRAATFTPDGGRTTYGVGPTEKIQIYRDGWACFAGSGSHVAIQAAHGALHRLSEDKAAEAMSVARLCREIGDDLQKASAPLINAVKSQTAAVPPEFIKRASEQAVNEGVFVRGVGRRGHEVPAIVNFSGGFTCGYVEAARGKFMTFGSGSVMSDPLMITLEGILFPDKLPTVEEGKLTVYWALHEVIECRAGGGVGGEPDLAVLAMHDGRFKVRHVENEEFDALKHQYDSLVESIRAGFYGAVREPRRAAPAQQADPEAAPPPVLGASS